MSGVEAEAIRAHVERIAASELFAGAQRLCRFLRFTVESTLNGKEGQVKEYSLGREVFDRGDDYDTRLDPIVRVEARRLRARLAEYYSGPGREETLRLDYPKGSYVPVVSDAAAAPVSRRLPIPPAAIAAIAVLTSAGIAAVFAFARPPQAAIAPVPLRWIEVDQAGLDPVDANLAEDVDAALANANANVVAWPEILRHQNARSTPLRDLAAGLRAGRLLVIVVRDEPEGKRVNVFRIEEPAGRKTLALSYENPPLATDAERNALAARIAGDLH